MRSIIALAAIAQLAAMGAMGEPVPMPRRQPEPEPMPDDGRTDHGAMRIEAALRPKRQLPNIHHQPTREDVERWEAERQSKLAARAAKRLAIDAAQRARGQHVA